MPINGTDVILAKSGGAVFAASTSCSLEVSADQVDVTNKSSNRKKEYMYGFNGYTISCDGLITLDDYDYFDMLTDQKNGTVITVTFTVDTKVITGTCNIESVSVEGPVEGVATYSVSLQGTGDYTLS
jgi:TP901-1 family phage major tail protein